MQFMPVSYYPHINKYEEHWCMPFGAVNTDRTIISGILQALIFQIFTSNKPTLFSKGMSSQKAFPQGLYISPSPSSALRYSTMKGTWPSFLLDCGCTSRCRCRGSTDDSETIILRVGLWRVCNLARQGVNSKAAICLITKQDASFKSAYYGCQTQMHWYA